VPAWVARYTCVPCGLRVGEPCTACSVHFICSGGSRGATAWCCYYVSSRCELSLCYPCHARKSSAGRSRPPSLEQPCPINFFNSHIARRLARPRIRISVSCQPSLLRYLAAVQGGVHRRIEHELTTTAFAHRDAARHNPIPNRTSSRVHGLSASPAGHH